MPKLKVIFVPTNVSGVNFWRVYQPAQALKKIGVEAKVMYYGHNGYLMHPWETDLLTLEHGPEIEKQMKKACEWADIMVFMALHTRHSMDLWQALRWQFESKPFLMEIDDYIFSIPPGNTAAQVFGPGTEIVKIFCEQMKASDGVIVSTPFLADLYKEMNPRIHVAENAIDFTLWRKKSPSPGRQGVTIGWVGGGSHTPDLELVKDPIFKVLERNPEVTFKCIHGCPEFFKHHDRIHWTHEFTPINEYPDWVSSFGFDIGIAPLVDNNFNRGKSNLRWLEYASLKTPSVCSPLPHFKQTIEHGVNGYLADTPDQWVEYLETLIKDEKKRVEIGERAYQDALQKFNITDMAVTYKNILLKEITHAVAHTFDTAATNRRFNRRPRQPSLEHI
jgi:glycosyltransferase involved in cell wall biosynthesis